MSDDAGRLPPQITSPANPRVKWLQGLRKRRVRDAARLTVVEGYDEIELALAAGVRPTQAFWCPGLVHDDSRLALAPRLTALGADVTRLGSAAFAKVTYRDSPDGWIAVVPAPGRDLHDLTLPTREPPLVLVCEAIEKPGNLGAMLRTAEAAGVHAVVAASPLADWGNPNVVRASKGTVFAVPVAAASSAAVVDWLREQRLQIVIATPDADEVVSRVDLARPTAVVVGAEHDGLSAAWFDAADRAASLPMYGHVNSLNVATSAAIVIYEALRQRGLPVSPP